MTTTDETPEPAKGDLLTLAGLFARLGATSFGGPPAHIALMQMEVVERRRWLTREAFLDLVSAAYLIPGPNSTELAMHVGLGQRGWLGLLVAGGCFIVPAALITCVLAWIYVQAGHLPTGLAVLNTIKPIMVAVVAFAVWKLAWTTVDKPFAVLLAIGALAANLAGLDEIAILGIAAAICVAGVRRRGPGIAAPAIAAVAPVIAAAGGSAATPVGFSLWALFTIFVKVGATLFGSGYVLLAFLQTDLVDRLHWITQAQLLDAIAAGQITPGPIFTTATFVGYLVGGPAGAVAATLGIFLPSFFLVRLTGPIIPKLRQSPVTAAILTGVNAASLGLMGAVAVRLGLGTIVDGFSTLLAVATLVALPLTGWNPTWFVLIGAGIGTLRLWTGF
jgi:chromate transporter